MSAIHFNTTHAQACVEKNITGKNASSLSKLSAKIGKLALGAFAIYALANVPGADAGLVSGLLTLGGCVGAGILFPASLFWAAAPCYELTMVATANPLLP